MKLLSIIQETFEDDLEHQATLKKTGFWGKMGAGCIIFSRESKRFLIQHRSPYVEQPNTYGTWGGAIDRKDSIENAVKREVKEEAGYTGNIILHPIYIFKDSSGFQYHNFIAEVGEEFKPILDWESQGFKWCEFGDWPSPLHFGLKSVLNDTSSVVKMKKLAST